MFDASSRKSIRAAEKLATRLHNDRIAFLRAALDTREGRAWFYHFLSDCHCWSQPPAFESSRDYFALGERNVGLRIFADITQNCADQYILMVREENVRLATDTAASERSRGENSGRDTQGRPGPDDPGLDPFADTDESGVET